MQLTVLTTSFRRIINIDEGQFPSGITTLSIPLVDDSNIPLANGLYCLILTTPSGKMVGKFIVLK